MSDKEPEETDWTDFAADIAKLRAHSPRDPMPRLDGKPPAGPPAEPRKEKPVRDIMHPSDKTCEAWSKLTPNRLTPEQAKAVSDWQARRRILDYWLQFMSLNGRQPTVREAKTALHIGGSTLTPNLRRLRKENKIPTARKPGRMKTIGKETIMTDKKPTSAENDKVNEKTTASELDRLKAYVSHEKRCEVNAGEDYKDYGDPIRQLERYLTILDDFANETIRIRRASYEAIKNDDCFVFAEHDFLNDILKTRRSMAALLKALKEGAVDE
ncbi:hypothetical protein [Bifidobacterium moukalabense]|uniref:hypothetical protein n=1 Tax=Bifidobacterium moukalabense TaxID=1333651 RepID=UPI0010F63FCD|nr:hypothetical protein [Bifidobacterium moukalabense]